MNFYPGKAEVNILDPIHTDKWKKDSLDIHIEEVRQTMSKAMT